MEQTARASVRPAGPPLYRVGNNNNVAYTYNQLQRVKPNEISS